MGSDTLEGRMAFLRLIQRALESKGAKLGCLWQGNEAIDEYKDPFLSMHPSESEAIEFRFEMPTSQILRLRISAINGKMETLRLEEVKAAQNLASHVQEIILDNYRVLALYGVALCFSVSVFGRQQRSTIQIWDLLVDVLVGFVRE